MAISLAEVITDYCHLIYDPSYLGRHHFAKDETRCLLADRRRTMISLSLSLQLSPRSRLINTLILSSALIGLMHSPWYTFYTFVKSNRTYFDHANPRENLSLKPAEARMNLKILNAIAQKKTLLDFSDIKFCCKRLEICSISISSKK